MRIFVAIVAVVLAGGCALSDPFPGSPPQAGEGVARAGIVDLAADGAPIVAHWKPRDAAPTPRPAVIALHGCAGLYLSDGRTVDPRYPTYVARLHAAGYHVLLPDSFTPRGSGSICTLKNSERTISVEMRRPDVIAAVNWLARQPNVDPKRIAVLGWSNGAISTLNAINSARPGFAAPLAGAVVFYPGCSRLLQRPFEVATPVLMLLGEKDDWTPAAPCVALADRTRAQNPALELTVRVFPDSYHGFDGTAALRRWTDVSSGVDPSGVHVGANPAARAKALADMDEFFARVLR